MSKERKWWPPWPFKKKKVSPDALVNALKPIYANGFKKIVMDEVTMGAMRLDPVTRMPVEMAVPKVIYGWVDPSAAIDEDHHWMLLYLANRFMEVEVRDNKDDSKSRMLDNPKVMTLEELKEGISCGDYSHMINEDTDLTVNEELEKLFNI